MVLLYVAGSLLVLYACFAIHWALGLGVVLLGIAGTIMRERDASERVEARMSDDKQKSYLDDV